MIVSLASMRRRLGRLEGRNIVDTLARVLVATAVLAALAWGVATAIGYGTPAHAIVAVIAALAVGGVAFLVTLRLLHVRELSLLRDAVRRRPLRAGADGD